MRKKGILVNIHGRVRVDLEKFPQAACVIVMTVGEDRDIALR